MSLGCLARFVALIAFNKAFVELSMRSRGQSGAVEAKGEIPALRWPSAKMTASGGVGDWSATSRSGWEMDEPVTKVRLGLDSVKTDGFLTRAVTV